MITLQGKIEIYDTNPRRAKLTIERPVNIGTDPAAEGHIVFTADQTETHFPNAVTGQMVQVQVDPSTID
jgi:hypothetical protein